MENLPSEILCMIFSYLDEKTLQYATSTCKLWFELIRRETNLSSCVNLRNMNVLEFHQKIENSDWIWSRWPVIKTLEFGIPTLSRDKPFTAKEAKDLHKFLYFEQCPTLEKVISSVSCYLTELLPYLHVPVGVVKKLTFNPRIDIESFKIEHVSSLTLVLDVNLSTGNSFEAKAKMKSLLKLIADNACNLSDLSISISKNYLKLEGSLGLLTNSFSNLFKKLYTSLQIVKLTVPKLNQIDYISHDCKTTLELCVEHVTLRELRKFDFSSMCLQFQNLTKCYIYGIIETGMWSNCVLRHDEIVIDLCQEHDIMSQWMLETKNYIDLATKCINCKKLMKYYIEVTEENQKEWTWNIEHIDFLCAEWEKIAFNVFQDKTEIKLDLIKCNRDDIIGMECTKLPFQRNFAKQLAIYK